MGFLSLCVETERYKNVFDREMGVFRRMNMDEQTCDMCKLDTVEDEIDFLLNCNIYLIERRLFRNLLQYNNLKFQRHE